MSHVKDEKESNELTKDELEALIAAKEESVSAARAASNAIVTQLAEARRNAGRRSTPETSKLENELDESIDALRERREELAVLEQQLKAMEEPEQAATPTPTPGSP